MSLRTPSLLRLLALLSVLGHPAMLAPVLAAEPVAPPAAVLPTELRSEQLVMTSTDTETTALATGNVVLTGTNLRITCDQLTVIATRIGDTSATVGDIEKIKYILATGNVRIIQGDRESTSQRAEVFPREDKVVLSEEPVIIDHSNGFVAAGEKITLFRGKREVLVEKPRFTGTSLGDMSASAVVKAPKPKSPPPPAPAPAPTLPRSRNP